VAVILALAAAAAIGVLHGLLITKIVASNTMSTALSWVLVIAVSAAYLATLLARARSRRRSGPALVLVCNQERGVPLVGALFVILTFVLKRTKFGRHIHAVGGNAEAARRAGISTDRMRIACFALCSPLAGIGGVVHASRLRSVDTNAGGGSILL
jgi:D-xylose transport system permease protein